MPIDIVRLLAFDGPNLLGPQPAVLLHARADADRTRRLRAALKDAALAVGVVVGQLEAEARAAGDGFALTVSLSTPTPALAAETVRFVVAGLNAREAGAEEGEDDEALWALQRRRRAEALPVAALQLLAEAAARGLPAFAQGGVAQLGYGSRGVSVRLGGGQDTLTPDDIGVGRPRAGAAPAVAWQSLGAVPVVALAGSAAAALAERVAAGLRARGLRVAAGAELGFDAARALLADPAADAVVLGLEAGDALRRGMPFERCAASALLGLPPPPPEAAGRDELARALGVAVLLTEPGGLALIGGDAEVAALAEYAPCRAERIAPGDIERAAEAILAALRP